MRLLRLLAVLCLASLAGLFPAGASAEPVKPADSFVDSIGVNVHMNYQDTVYVQTERLVDKLAAAGIRHVRDGLDWDTPYAYAAFNQLADRGIGVTFIMGDPSERRDTLDELLTVLQDEPRVRKAAEAVEGPNEYGYNGTPEWAAEMRAYQERLFSAVKSNPDLAHLPVLAPSFVTWQDHAELGELGGAIDFGNKHPYPGGDLPEANLENELSVAARVSGNRPIWVTESGYHNALATDSGHRPASEEATATYLPRMFLEYFRRGVARTFSYELIDLWPDPDKRNLEANFGLLRNDYSEKPAFRSLANLIALLADPGGPHELTPLDYIVEGAPSDLRQLVLQKRDGSHHLVLWRAVRVWDPVARRPLNAEARNVTVRVAGSFPAGAQAQIFRPVQSSALAAASPVGEGVQVSLGADPVIIRFPLSSAAPPSQPAPPAEEVPAAPSVTVAGPQVVIPSRRRLRRVLKKGLRIRCRAQLPGRCKAAVRRRGGGVLARGNGARSAAGSKTMRLRLTTRGRRVLRRAVRRRRAMSVTVEVQPGSARLVRRRVVLHPAASYWPRRASTYGTVRSKILTSPHSDQFAP